MRGLLVVKRPLPNFTSNLLKSSAKGSEFHFAILVFLNWLDQIVWKRLVKMLFAFRFTKTKIFYFREKKFLVLSFMIQSERHVKTKLWPIGIANFFEKFLHPAVNFKTIFKNILKWDPRFVSAIAA